MIRAVHRLWSGFQSCYTTVRGHIRLRVSPSRAIIPRESPGAGGLLASRLRERVYPHFTSDALASYDTISPLLASNSAWASFGLISWRMFK